MMTSHSEHNKFENMLCCELIANLTGWYTNWSAGFEKLHQSSLV